MAESTSPAPLSTLLGDYPTTRALREGRVASPLVPLAFADVAVPNTAFKRVVRQVEFDVAELALMTFLMARSRGVPIRLLPVVLFSRNPLPHLVCNVERRPLTPAELPGRRIGVRMYTTTTAVWIRELLADQCGVDWATVEWLTQVDGHVPDVPEPSTVRRGPDTPDLVTMLREGSIDAAIVDKVPADRTFAPVVHDAAATCRAWERKHGARTLNHVVVVRESIAGDEEKMRELFGLFRESRALGGAAVDPAASPLGFEANRRHLEVALSVASAQGLLAKPLSLDDLVTPVLKSLE